MVVGWGGKGEGVAGERCFRCLQSFVSFGF